MAERRRPLRRAVLFGFAAATVLVAVALVLAPRATDLLARRTADAVAAVVAPPPGATPPVVVVDVDAASLELVGPWPWRRGVVADLVEIAARSGAAVVAIDVVFSGEDERSPAALARRLGAAIDRADLTRLADDLADDDRRLAAAIARVPTVLGWAFGPRGDGDLGGSAITAAGALDALRIWTAPGVEAPPARLIAAAAGTGTTALPGDGDGVVRDVPLAVEVGGRLRPGLALEAVRVATGAATVRLDPAGGGYSVGDRGGRLGETAMLRLAPIDGARRPTIVSAADLLTSDGSHPALAGAVVVIGGSAPEMGGLRATAGRTLTASAEIQAAAIRQIFDGRTPTPLGPAGVTPAVVALAVALVAAALAASTAPLIGAGLAAATVVALLGAAAMAMRLDRLLDPALPILAAASAHAVAATIAYSAQTAEARRIRRRFEQHLSPSVVELIARDPSLLRLKGERRIVTALFTDVADFTAMTRGADPERLVEVLDTYFEGMTRIVVAHGGMIDKFVGDAVHAYFNVPLDLDDHAAAAVACAIELERWSEAARRAPEAAALGFGRTRIGIETGPAIVGEIGLGSKLDYTAHGDAVNAAARLEAANKTFGTSICVGPGTAALCPPGLLVAIGRVDLRGLGADVAVWTPAAAARAG